MPAGLSGKRCFKAFFDKPLPKLFQSTAGQSGPFGYRAVRVIFFRKQQCLCPFPFFSAMLSLVDYFPQSFFSSGVKVTIYFFVGIDSLPIGFYALIILFFYPLCQSLHDTRSSLSGNSNTICINVSTTLKTSRKYIARNIYSY
jgi:hypothetical protein